MRPILVGAVIYDPKVSVIWDIISRFFSDSGCVMDCVFYTNYELQVSALLAGQIDIAWNSPLAWVDAVRRAPGHDFRVRRHDLLAGKHGDHVGGELDALHSLLVGDSDAACVLDLNWELWRSDGTADPGRVRVLATTPPFDHCNFTIADGLASERAAEWTPVLLSMRHENPAHREMMDMEGLKAWLPGRTSGYSELTRAAEEQNFFGPAAS